jgi:hypothetical protein
MHFGFLCYMCILVSQPGISHRFFWGKLRGALSPFLAKSIHVTPNAPFGVARLFSSLHITRFLEEAENLYRGHGQRSTGARSWGTESSHHQPSNFHPEIILFPRFTGEYF